MTLEQIMSEIRRLSPSERIELCRWLDYETAADHSSNDFCSRIGAVRSGEIRNALNEAIKPTLPATSLRTASDSRAAARVQKTLSLPGRTT
jgi:hypothetical protein